MLSKSSPKVNGTLEMFLRFLYSQAQKCGPSIAEVLAGLEIGFGGMNFNGRINLATIMHLLRI